ncbi:hypothetical protein PGB90_008985 [Kerria lacca]
MPYYYFRIILKDACGWREGGRTKKVQNIFTLYALRFSIHFTRAPYFLYSLNIRKLKGGGADEQVFIYLKIFTIECESTRNWQLRRLVLAIFNRFFFEK